MAFVPNNIRFRSVTSKALEQFYNAKSYILNELITEKNQFSEVSRELLLLQFNSYTQWATDTEYMLLNCKIVDAIYVEALIADIDKIARYHEQIYDIHTYLFAPEFVSKWKNTSIEAFKNAMLKLEGMDHMVAFPTLMGYLTQYLQTCMYELYELDCLLGSAAICSTNKSNCHQILLYVDDFVLDYEAETSVFLCAERLRRYTEIANLPVLVKNYSTRQLRFCGRFEGDSKLVDLLQPLCEEFTFLNVVTPPPPEDVLLYNTR